MLSRSALIVQAAVLDGEFLDLLPAFDDGRMLAEVDVGGGKFVQALVITVVSRKGMSFRCHI
jgi:hypothetical protein